MITAIEEINELKKKIEEIKESIRELDFAIATNEDELDRYNTYNR